MQKLQRTGNREREIREFFEGLENYMNQNYPRTNLSPLPANQTRRRKSNGLRRVVTTNHTVAHPTN